MFAVLSATVFLSNVSFCCMFFKYFTLCSAVCGFVLSSAIKRLLNIWPVATKHMCMRIVWCCSEPSIERPLNREQWAHPYVTGSEFINQISYMTLPVWVEISHCLCCFTLLNHSFKHLNALERQASSYKKSGVIRLQDHFWYEAGGPNSPCIILVTTRFESHPPTKGTKTKIIIHGDEISLRSNIKAESCNFPHV